MSDYENEIFALAKQCGHLLLNHKQKLVTAESCTGGWVSEAITSVAGSSKWFDRGFVTYTNVAKVEMLGVKSATLERHGAVSEEVVIEMAAGALAHSHAQYSVAVSGIAGPTGGSAEKPIGTVWFAWAHESDTIVTSCHHFQGNRTEIREQSVIMALEGIVARFHVD